MKPRYIRALFYMALAVYSMLRMDDPVFAIGFIVLARIELGFLR